MQQLIVHITEQIPYLKTINTYEDFKKIVPPVQTEIKKLFSDLMTLRQGNLINPNKEENVPMPEFYHGMDEEKYRKSLYQWITHFKSPGLMIQKMNEAQKKIPFLLIYGGKGYGPSVYNANIVYKMGDLFRFIKLYSHGHEILGSAIPLSSETQSQINPFYVPLENYVPTVDFKLNDAFSVLETQSLHVLPQIKSILSITDAMSPIKDYITISQNYASIGEKLLTLFNSIMDPLTMIKMIPGQEGPMSNYAHDNFNMIVANFLQKHKIHNPRPKKIIEGIVNAKEKNTVNAYKTYYGNVLGS